MISSGDTAWMLVSTALVMLMTPGLGLFYAGMVRTKNVLGTIMHSFMCLGIVSIIWVFYGYSLAFGPDMGGFIGSLDWAGLTGVGMKPGPYSKHNTAPCLLRISTYVCHHHTGTHNRRICRAHEILGLHTLYHSMEQLLCTCPCVTGYGAEDGWVKSEPLDFAGGTVIHILAGVGALSAAMIVGKRKGYRKEPFYPHNLTMTMIGAAILWFGWFGFNAGSALAANGVAGLAFFATHIATAAAALSWIIFEKIIRGRPTTLGFASGAVAGLVAITPAAGFVTPLPAMVIGFFAGMLCYFAILAKEKFGYDDSLDVVGVHGVGGLWGALATGLFASVGGTGLFYGNPHQLWVQVIASVTAIVFSFIMTSIILLIVKKIIGLRVDEESEEVGLDQSMHGEAGYYLR